MRTIEEQEKLILKRAEGLRKRRQKRITSTLFCVTAALMLVLTGSLYTLTGGYSAIAGGSSFGAFMLSSEAGGYILVTVLDFASGAAAALTAVRYTQRKKGAAPPDEDKKDSS